MWGSNSCGELLVEPAVVSVLLPILVVGELRIGGKANITLMRTLNLDDIAFVQMFT
ncbi:hypothetical protein D3C80_1742900 [compost metagenome]